MPPVRRGSRASPSVGPDSPAAQCRRARRNRRRPRPATPPAGPARPRSRRTTTSRCSRPPLWKWEIASYFFLGGLSGGAYVLARMAERFGGGELPRRDPRRHRIVGAGRFLPCPPLLIHDLGDPQPLPPHAAGVQAVHADEPGHVGDDQLQRRGGRGRLARVGQGPRQGRAGRAGQDRRRGCGSADRAVITVTDVAGVPLALLLIGYTGVLLSCTANPLWSKNPWLGALFSASAISTGAAATSLGLDLTGSDPDGPSAAAPGEDRHRRPRRRGGHPGRLPAPRRPAGRPADQGDDEEAPVGRRRRHPGGGGAQAPAADRAPPGGGAGGWPP